MSGNSCLISASQKEGGGIDGYCFLKCHERGLERLCRCQSPEEWFFLKKSSRTRNELTDWNISTESSGLPVFPLFQFPFLLLRVNWVISICNICLFTLFSVTIKWEQEHTLFARSVMIFQSFEFVMIFQRGKICLAFICNAFISQQPQEEPEGKKDRFQFHSEFEFEFNTSSCEKDCLKAQIHMYVI